MIREGRVWSQWVQCNANDRDNIIIEKNVIKGGAKEGRTNLFSKSAHNVTVTLNIIMKRSNCAVISFFISSPLGHIPFAIPSCSLSSVRAIIMHWVFVYFYGSRTVGITTVSEYQAKDFEQFNANQTQSTRWTVCLQANSNCCLVCNIFLSEIEWWGSELLLYITCLSPELNYDINIADRSSGNSRFELLLQ